MPTCEVWWYEITDPNTQSKVDVPILRVGVKLLGFDGQIGYSVPIENFPDPKRVDKLQTERTEQEIEEVAIDIEDDENMDPIKYSKMLIEFLENDRNGELLATIGAVSPKAAAALAGIILSGYASAASLRSLGL